jgi:hypothetical protein
LFFDFAGYSLMVIGIARLFGIKVAENFDHPFLSITPSKFWTRWHMSLSFWIRDYLFVPLAAARRNSWYHGLLLVGHRLGQQAKRRFQISMPSHLGAFLSGATTFLLVSLGWIFFRANKLTVALSMLSSVVSPGTYLHLAMPRNFYVLTAAITAAYFVIAAGRSLLFACLARYRDTLSRGTESIVNWWPTGLTLTTGRAVDFLAVTLWWWFGPAVVVLAVFAGLAISKQNTAIAVTPFIYTLF